ncbi:hypothetical protein JG688_00017904 [Phytophthora aleatoria]|uniref:Uncharacterized protein n=1 Tax=Phytophthora aleatoria TaxID=2496075 RepID=A0A8J5LY88_9STRA|nr:hypothetical protein JG688_00017904 [Phytophthora aleatoria]
MEQRWGFVLSWCRVLRQKIKYMTGKRTWDVWREQKHRLEVKLPMRCQFTQDSDGEEFDFSWSGKIFPGLIRTSSRVTEFYLILDQEADRRSFMEDHLGLDLVLFCGTDHRTRPTKEYL